MRSIEKRLSKVNAWLGLAAAGISAAASLGGGLLSASSNSSSNASRSDDAIHMNQMNIDAQREFAQNGVRWKVDDAKAAGLHPLAALGAQTNSFTPVTASGGHQPTDYSFIGDMGQDIAGAISRGKTEEEKALFSFQLKNAQADLDIKMAEKEGLQLANAKTINDMLMGPPIPSARGNSYGGLIQQGGTTLPSSLMTHEPAIDPVTGKTYLVPTEAGERSPYQVGKGSLREMGQDVSNFFNNLWTGYDNAIQRHRQSRYIKQMHKSH